MRIAIIGAGAAGLAALRLSLHEGHECIVFEQTDKIGGTWNYTDRIDVDEYGLPVHSSMYQGLHTNLPKELMEYEGFPHEEKGKSFLKQQEVIEYIQNFAIKYNLYSHIKFLRHILEIGPLPNKGWKIMKKDLKTKEITEHIVDVVIICVGNYSVPFLPNIPGSQDLQERAIHSHRFRRPDAYKGKKVLIIGAGPSGVDIARLVDDVAEKVYLSYGETIFGKTKETVIHKPLVKSFENDKVIFKDGSEEEIDNVIFCTGYQYTYPFLTPECKISIENNWIKYLYKHIVNVEHPTMGFIGITFKVCPFPTFEIQAKFFLEFLKDTTKISKDEMMADILKDVQNRKDQSEPQHHVHQIGAGRQKKYFDDLANTVKIKNVKPVIHKLYQYLHHNRDITKRYKMISDDEYIEYV